MVRVEVGPDACLGEDELLELARGTLASAPDAETHLATCATCSSLLAEVVRITPARTWDELAGQTLGPYRIDAQIGTGGMGAVYRAWDPRLGRAIAIKVLHEQSADHAERLATEARAAAAIEHHAIVRIYDVGCADGIHYVAMELVEGESLRSVLASGALAGARARELIAALADGLVAAHARGVIHRDLKPENLVLVAREGAEQLRILDFGLAQLADATETSAPGSAVGTAGYMAPEQARGLPADARADVFATGAVAYELLTGRRAFPGATNADRLTATLREVPPCEGLGELGPVVARCLAKEPRDRFQTAADLAWAVRSAVPAATLAATSPASAPPASTGARDGRTRISRRAMLLGSAAALGAGGLGFVLGRRRPPAAESAEAFGARRLTHRTGRVYTARFTPDGSRVVFGAAWDDEPIGVRVIDLASGETTPLDLPSADVLAVSAHGQLAISLAHRFVEHQSMGGQLALISLAGGVPRPLAEGVQDADFAPDGMIPGVVPVIGDAAKFPGGSLAVVRATPRGFRIELPLGTPLVEEPGWITHVRVSPAGGHVAYLHHPQTNDDGGELKLCDVATRATRVLSDDWTSLAGLVWDPAGDRLWFTGSREDLSNVLYHSTLDGTVVRTGAPTAGRLRLHDVSADRRALVTDDTWRLRSMAGDRDRSMSAISYVSDLSADGAYVLIGELGDVVAGNGAYLVPYGAGRTLRLGPGFPIAVSPSGQRVAANVREATRLVVYSTSSGEAPVIKAPGFVTRARWLDERSLIAAWKDRLWRLSLDHDPVALTGTGGAFALDPARRRCAYLDNTATLHLLDLATGTTRPLAANLTRVEVCGWLAEPDAVVVRSTTTPIVVDRIDPVTGARTRHAEIQPPPMGLKAVDSFVLHADGKRYAYSYGHELSQLLLMTLPA